MMEETQTIFAVGAGAVTKLVDYKKPNEGFSKIVRIFNPKYPYEYLKKHAEANKVCDDKKSFRDEVLEFYNDIKKTKI